MRDFLGIGNRGRRTLGEKVGGSEYVEGAAISVTPRSLKVIQPAPRNGSLRLESEPVQATHPTHTVMHICMPLYQITFVGCPHAPPCLAWHTPLHTPRGVGRQPSCRASQPAGKVKDGCVAFGGMRSNMPPSALPPVSHPPAGRLCMYPCMFAELHTDIQTQIHT